MGFPAGLNQFSQPEVFDHEGGLFFATLPVKMRLVPRAKAKMTGLRRRTEFFTKPFYAGFVCERIYTTIELI